MQLLGWRQGVGSTRISKRALPRHMRMPGRPEALRLVYEILDDADVMTCLCS